MTKFRIATYTVVAILVAGCASSGTPSGEFLDPISDESVDLFGQVRFGMPLQDSILLYQYIEQGDPTVDEWETIRSELTRAVVVMVDYSVAMVDLLQGDSNEASIDAMIGLIQDLHIAVADLPAAQAMSSDLDYDAMMASMREQESIKDALKIALPEIEFVSDTVRQMISDADAKLAPAVRVIEKMIDDRHGSIRRFAGDLAERRAVVLEQLVLVGKAYNGDETAFRQILANDWAIRDEIGADAKFNAKTIAKTEKLVMKRLENIADIREYLEPAYRDYQSQLMELYALRTGLDQSLGVMNLIVQGWEQSQRQLARGEKSSFGKLTSSLMKMAYSKATR